MVNGIFYVLKNGCVWRDVPADFSPGSTVYDYFTQWTADGTWARVSGCLTIEAREREKKAQPTAAVLDSQSVKNTATSTACVGYDVGKRVNGRKRFFLVDPAGNLLASCVVATNCLDGATAARVWGALALGNELPDRLQTVFVDGCFGVAAASLWRGVRAHLPAGVVADKGRFFIHARRWVVERSIAWAGTNRRLAKTLRAQNHPRQRLALPGEHSTAD